MEQNLTELADAVAKTRNADVVVYNGPMSRPADAYIISQCIQRNRRKNVFVVLVTEGGGADPAYRIARCFQTQYERFTLCVTGFCKSAGTLVAVGAHDLVMSDHGELGPLDVQMVKKDSVLWETQSGLTVMSTLNTLQHKATDTFQQFFSSLLEEPSSITLRTAAEIATKMTAGLYAPLYSQVDPLHVGEAGRAMSIAYRYGGRLLEQGRNITQDNLEVIISSYPSHGYVIDRTEAAELFTLVCEPTEEEVRLVDALDKKARIPLRPQSPESAFRFLSTEPDSDKQKDPLKEKSQ